jgi:hypothetical protein
MDTNRGSLRSRRLVLAGEERASFEETPAQMPMIYLFFSVITQLKFNNNFTRVSKIWRLLMLSRELLYFKYLGFEIQLKPEYRKSIINLLCGEDAGYRDSSYGKSENQSLPEQGSNIQLQLSCYLFTLKYKSRSDSGGYITLHCSYEVR